MLRFSPQQQAALKANRSEFNARQADLAGGRTAVANAMLGNALPLPYNVWGEWDRESVVIQRQVMAVFNDLAATLSTSLPIGKLVHFFKQVSDSGQVNVSMDGRSKGRTDQQTYNYQGTPVPIIDSPFGYGWRQVEAAQTDQTALDDDGRTNAMYHVAQKLEGLALDGDATIVVGGSQLYGLRTHPKRNTRSTGVTLNGATGQQWVSEFTATLKLLHNKNFKVPCTIYLNYDDWFYAGSTDAFATYGGKTILQRMMDVPGVQAILPSDTVTANQIIAVVKDKRVVQVLSAMPMATRALFRANLEDDYDFVTMAAAAIEIKYDATNNCGIAVSS